MRLIDADELRKRMYHDAFETDSDWQKWDSGCWIRYKMFENAIEDAPTIEAEPVRHGHWVSAAGENVPFDENIKGDPYCPCDSVWCSECGAWLTASDEYFVTGRYCPNCGAKMEEQE